MAKGTVLWRRTENPDEDIWDDSDLIAAYDQAYEKVKKEIESRNRTSSENSSAGPEPSTGWKQGDYCIAVYSGDKLPYEAKIKCIRKKHCIVHYIGYGNEERVLLSDLYPSEGKKARQAQQARAGSLPSEPPWGAANLGVPFSSSSRGTPPLPAHPPLILDNSAESEALSSMLMAWYMSGYHTGYYQALQQSRQTRK
ncbi:survival motor neuron protein isoform X2 [Rhipicephalus microplus]|uniref:survival motor neuron protein isoform X2 n=1 Tax=Rhipicephalus microplus TaxID=6941 RepID=UPI003F6A9868